MRERLPTPTTLLPGTLVGGRFVVESPIGSGGMADVFRARDRQTGDVVAVKVLRGQTADEESRFVREAELLARFDHPAIVRYLAHGEDPAGPLWLAMEWLEGEDLGARMARVGLGMAECVAVGRRIAEALAVFHGWGIVHRDIKPSNILLVGGNIRDARLIDFGVARMETNVSLTRTGVTIGTPQYMAPEQARGERVGTRADIFALGSVLYATITGNPPFAASHVLAMLVKVVLEDPPRLGEVREDVPEQLDALVASMLSKVPDERPDAARVVAELAAVADIVGEASQRAAPITHRRPELTTTEQVLRCLVLARPFETSDLSEGETVALEAVTGSREALRHSLSRFGAHADELADGTILVHVTGSAPASEQVTQAARSALAVSAVYREAPVALVAGRAVGGERLPLGGVVARGIAMLAKRPTAIRVDDVVAGLLDGRFDLGSDGEDRLLFGEREMSTTRTLLGRPTPFVGRERELQTLEMVFGECVEERVARTVLVTAPAGIGKSRFRHEFVRRVRYRGEDVEVWMARGDPMRHSSPLGLLSDLLRGAIGIEGTEAAAQRYEQVRARVAAVVESEGDPARVAEFVGELVGAPSLGEPSVQLAAARRDPVLMADQTTRAWEDFASAACGRRPVLVVIDDLHWGDAPTVRALDAALRALHDRPFMVLALGRPEVAERFPKIWAGRGLTEIELGDLPRRAAQKLVTGALGTLATPETVERVLERAGGNAFFLEELIRAVSLGKRGDLPETVLAMVEARLATLDDEARRALRAASLFGRSFWPGAVAHLLGGERKKTDVAARLSRLAQQEFLSRHADSRFGREDEYAFRHALLRDAAYAMLTDDDKKLGHRLAGEWLEGAGEGDALVLAEHFERGGDAQKAVAWFRRAAEQAFEANDLPGVLARAERGIANGGSGEAFGALCLLKADALRWRGDLVAARRSAAEALEALPEGTPLRYQVAGELCVIAGRLGGESAMIDAARSLSAADPQGRAQVGAWVRGTARAVPTLYMVGQLDLAEALLARMMAALPEVIDREPGLQALVFYARAWQALCRGDVEASLRLDAACADAFERIGDHRNACEQRVAVGFELMQMGAYAQAERVLSAALATATRMELWQTCVMAKHNLGLALAMLGSLEEARRIETEAVEAFVGQGARRIESGARIYLAIIATLAGDLETAEREARAAVSAAPERSPTAAWALAILSRVLLAEGRISDAFDPARQAFELLETLALDEGESTVRLAWAEALAASGDREAAARAITVARDRLLARAARITDAEWRASFLSAVPENARTIALAQSWSRS